MGNKLNVYLAGMFFTKALRKIQAAELRENGIGVTSRWMDEAVPHTVSMADVPDAYHAETAEADLEDIHNADILVSFVPTDSELTQVSVATASRGGRHVELGYALALGKPIYVVGPKENVFHHLPGKMTHFSSFEALKQYLIMLSVQRQGVQI
jgi:nucleoside 2-deoxyribosyltransferase